MPKCPECGSTDVKDTGEKEPSDRCQDCGHGWGKLLDSPAFDRRFGK